MKCGDIIYKKDSSDGRLFKILLIEDGYITIYCPSHKKAYTDEASEIEKYFTKSVKARITFLENNIKSLSTETKRITDRLVSINKAIEEQTKEMNELMGDLHDKN